MSAGHICKVLVLVCKDLHSEQANLLLYKLLHENEVMKAFILSRTDIEKMIEPLLLVSFDNCS